jgi:hypothetical protein
MSRAKSRSSRLADRPRHPGTCLFNPLEFYREEFLKHQRCLERQREYFSEQAIQGVEGALQAILGRLETLCRQQDADRVLSTLLKKLDTVTRLSAWDDHGRLH